MSLPMIPFDTTVSDPFAEPVVPEGVEDLLNPQGSDATSCCGGGCCS